MLANRYIKNTESHRSEHKKYIHIGICTVQVTLLVLMLELTSHLQVGVGALLPHQHHWPPLPRFPGAVVLQGQPQPAALPSTESIPVVKLFGEAFVIKWNDRTFHFPWSSGLLWERKINPWLAGGVIPRQHFPHAFSIVGLISVKNTKQTTEPQVLYGLYPTYPMWSSWDCFRLPPPTRNVHVFWKSCHSDFSKMAFPIHKYMCL